LKIFELVHAFKLLNIDMYLAEMEICILKENGIFTKHTIVKRLGPVQIPIDVYHCYPTPLLTGNYLKGGVQRDISGRNWYQSIGLPFTKRRPDFQLNPSIPQGAKAL